jgi:hypothetical protein
MVRRWAIASTTIPKFLSETRAVGEMAGIESKSESIPIDFNFTRADNADESKTAPCHA